MQIAETQTTDEFPEGAIKVRSGGGVLLKVTDRTGTAILWERDGVGEVAVPDLPLEVQPEYPKVACPHCPMICGNKGALTGHIRGKHPPVPQVVKEVEDFLDGVFPPALPKPAIQALESLLSNATFQSVRKVGDRPMEDFFYGFASGMQAALAIVCGTLGYNTDFLNEEITDSDTDT